MTAGKESRETKKIFKDESEWWIITFGGYNRGYLGLLSLFE